MNSLEFDNLDDVEHLLRSALDEIKSLRTRSEAALAAVNARWEKAEAEAKIYRATLEAIGRNTLDPNLAYLVSMTLEESTDEA